MSIEAWAPVILAALAFLTALLKHLGKKKAERAVGVMVDAVEKHANGDDSAIKKDIAKTSELENVGELIQMIVAERTKTK